MTAGKGSPIPYFENLVQAGTHTNVGDIVWGDYVMVPKSLVLYDAMFCVTVKGDSMEECGIFDGDTLYVQMTDGWAGVRAIYRFLAEDCGLCLPDIKTYADFIRKMIA